MNTIPLLVCYRYVSSLLPNTFLQLGRTLKKERQSLEELAAMETLINDSSDWDFLLMQLPCFHDICLYNFFYMDDNCFWHQELLLDESHLSEKNMSYFLAWPLAELLHASLLC